jgi:hypothetical protein
LVDDVLPVAETTSSPTPSCSGSWLRRGRRILDMRDYNTGDRRSAMGPRCSLLAPGKPVAGLLPLVITKMTVGNQRAGRAAADVNN